MVDSNKKSILSMFKLDNRKEKYVDYDKMVEEYFGNDSKTLAKDINRVEEQKDYVIWIQSFSKKVVSILLLCYLIATIFQIVIIVLSGSTGYIGLDTFISEINQTFRVVIGGYLIKSGVENAFKITGNYFVGINTTRLNALKSKYSTKEPEESFEEEPNFDEPNEVDEAAKDAED